MARSKTQAANDAANTAADVQDQAADTADDQGDQGDQGEGVTQQPAQTQQRSPFHGKARDAEPPAAKRKPAAVAADASDEEEESDAADDKNVYVDEIDLEELEALRAAAAKAEESNKKLSDLNKQLRKLQEQVQGYEREKLSEAEKRELDLKNAQSERDRLLSELRATRAEQEIARVAATLNVDPALATKLVMPDVAYDDSGKPENVETLIRAAMQQFPSIVVQPRRSSGEQSGGNPASGKRDGKRALTLEDVQGMSEDEINRRWDEIAPLLEAQASTRR